MLFLATGVAQPPGTAGVLKSTEDPFDKEEMGVKRP
jgi:hypothetical protein